MASNAMLVEIRPIYVTPASSQSSSVTVLPASTGSAQVDAFRAGLEELRDIVCAVSNHSQFRLAPSVEELIERATEMHGIPADVESWARRLAEDVGNLAD